MFAQIKRRQNKPIEPKKKHNDTTFFKRSGGQQQIRWFFLYVYYQFLPLLAPFGIISFSCYGIFWHCKNLMLASSKTKLCVTLEHVCYVSQHSTE